MNTLKPCSYCGNTSFNYLPNVTLDAGISGGLTAAGALLVKHNKVNCWWTFTVVACTQCGNTLLFTTNADAFSKRIDGSKIIHSGG